MCIRDRKNPKVTDPSVDTALDCGTVPTTLDAGAHITCTGSHVITQADLDGGRVKNTATGTATFGGTTLSQTATKTVTAVASPSIEVTKTASVEGASNPLKYDAVGQVVDYTI